jgi:DNA-binding beta-propeller fold protein YncE
MGRTHYKTVALAFISSIWLAACVKDKPANPVTDGASTATHKVYVVCEGSLGNGNSSLGLYDLEKEQVYDDVYKAANNMELGDVFQSITEIDGRLFLCINNSDKILVIDKSNHQLIATIPVAKPRYILPISSTKAYVSTLFSNKVFVINPQTLLQTGIIETPALNPEGMLLHNGSAYICCWDTASDKIFKINPATDKIEQEIAVAGRAPQEILEDKDHNLWVLSGNQYKGKTSALTCIDGTNDLRIKSYQFAAKADPIKPVFNSTKDILYFIEVNYNGGIAYNGIYKMPVYDAELPSQPLIAAKEYQYYWALSIEPATGNIYVGDPKGFVQKGTVAVYDANGNFVKQWNTGVGPGHFYFLK